MITRRIDLGVLLLVTCAALGACRYNDQYCEGNPGNNCLIDGAKSCRSDPDCASTPATPICEQMICVQCTTARSEACMGVTPVCGGDHACRGCASHAECPASGVCLPDGACGDSAMVAYVDPAGSDNMSCTKATPCTKLSKALLTNRPYVKLTGTTDEGGTLTIDNRDVVLLAEPGARLVRTSNGLHVEVKGTSQVAIYDLEISGGSGAQGIGISMPAGNTARLTLTRVKVINNAGGGITASGGTLTVTQSTISGNAGGGITASGGTLTVTQSTISGNTGGGITASGAQFDLTNNFIVGNGGPTGFVGGIDFTLIPSAGSRRLEFNTIANNAGTGTINSGINCGTVVTPVTFTNNIIYGNTVSMGGKQLGGSANCLATYSDIGPDSAAGTGNINAAPLFVSVLQSNFHLDVGSPAQDKADPTATLAVDADGDARPQGPARDMGADERR